MAIKRSEITFGVPGPWRCDLACNECMRPLTPCCKLESTNDSRRVRRSTSTIAVHLRASVVIVPLELDSPFIRSGVDSDNTLGNNLAPNPDWYVIILILTIYISGKPRVCVPQHDC